MSVVCLLICCLSVGRAAGFVFVLRVCDYSGPCSLLFGSRILKQYCFSYIPPLFPIDTSFGVTRLVSTSKVARGGDEENGRRFGDGYLEVNLLLRCYRSFCCCCVPIFRGHLERFGAARLSLANHQRGSIEIRTRSSECCNCCGCCRLGNKFGMDGRPRSQRATAVEYRSFHSSRPPRGNNMKPGFLHNAYGSDKSTRTIKT